MNKAEPPCSGMGAHDEYGGPLGHSCHLFFDHQPKKTSTPDCVSSVSRRMLPIQVKNSLKPTAT